MQKTYCLFQSRKRYSTFLQDCSCKIQTRLLIAFSALVIVFSSIDTHAAETICAEVKIEIRQEMTFERQGFDAHMNIDNGLTSISLENIRVDVLFSDKDGKPVKASSDPNDPDALFFIIVSSMTGTDDVDGRGSLAPSSKADIHWLIIPAPASVENDPTGALYYVGARLAYTINSEEQVTEVTPDYIHVNPLPMLTLDYFLPDEVYGDDPFTDEIEPAVPFTLGVRISNSGHGVASDVKIDSAQPKIVENSQGLAVDFTIIGSEVNGISAPNTLLIAFGDIQPSQATIGRWLMTSSLSGRFVDFSAQYSHADELGGELTSIIEEVNTHMLVRDVLVDAPGRDNLRDFLGRDHDNLKVYESDSGITEVVDISSSSSLSIENQNSETATYTITTPRSSGFTYLRLNDPQAGGKVLQKIVRSDGKILKPENGWLSRKRVDSSWTHYINLFDQQSTGQYQATFIHPSLVPVPPTLPEKQEDPVGKEGTELVLIITASDRDSSQAVLQYRYGSVNDLNCVPSVTPSPISITAGRLPVGATFIDCGNGIAILRWKPEDGQSGTYPFSFTATNEQGSSSIRYHVEVTDKDNVPTAHFTADFFDTIAPAEVRFSDQSQSVDGIRSWHWNFGDGNTSTLQNPHHTYQERGTYTVSLVVREIDGDMDTFTRSDYIRIEDPQPPGPPVIGPPSMGCILQFLLSQPDEEPRTPSAVKILQ